MTLTTSATAPYDLCPDFDNLAGVNRLERAFAILAKPHDIKKINANTYMVKSQRGLVSYLVTPAEKTGWKCTCPDCVSHGEGWECKHIIAVKHYIERKEEHLNELSTHRDWSAYTMAQKSEGELFPVYLRQIVDTVTEPERKAGKGRKPVPLSDNIFMAVMKVASQLSSRRAYKDVTEFMDKKYNYNGVNIFLHREDITPILRELLQRTAEPLSMIESTFAIDASGFGTYQFGDWKTEKWGGRPKQHTFVKCHIACGVMSHIITDAIITDSTVGDMNVLPTLLDGTNGQFTIREVLADAGYLSNKNYAKIASMKARGYIYFKDNVTGNRGCPAWKEAAKLFLKKDGEFERHYRMRKNVETVFYSIKMKFQEKLKSVDFVAQVNELYCKLIAYNISVIIRMAHTDNLEVMFK